MPTRSLRDNAYAVDETFFDVIDSEVKAYTLGFWMADGCNQQDVPVVRMGITDREILVDMVAAMGWAGPIHEVRPSVSRKTRLVQYVVNIGSRRLSDGLARQGCVANKTRLAVFPSDMQVPTDLQRHLIRGWSDGDGTITCKPGRRYWHSRIVGTESVCRGMVSCVKRHLGFSGNVCAVCHGKSHTTWAFTVAGYEDLKTYLAWLYHDATIYLGRKHAKYQEFLASR